jgi:hypothetical protein
LKTKLDEDGALPNRLLQEVMRFWYEHKVMFHLVDSGRYTGQSHLNRLPVCRAAAQAGLGLFFVFHLCLCFQKPLVGVV